MWAPLVPLLGPEGGADPLGRKFKNIGPNVLDRLPLLERNEAVEPELDLKPVSSQETIVPSSVARSAGITTTSTVSPRRGRARFKAEAGSRSDEVGGS